MNALPHCPPSKQTAARESASVSHKYMAARMLVGWLDGWSIGMLFRCFCMLFTVCYIYSGVLGAAGCDTHFHLLRMVVTFVIAELKLQS